MIFIILCALFGIHSNANTGNRRHGIYGQMKVQRIDSVHVIYYHSLLTNSNLHITVKRDTVIYRLDSLGNKEGSGNWRWYYYEPKITEDKSDYILSCINSFFIAKNKSIYKYRKRNDVYAESDDDELRIKIYYSNKRKKENWYILGDPYDTVPNVAGRYTLIYTREFRRFLQFIISITATQGPYSERYYGAMQDAKLSPDCEVFDFNGE